MSAGGNRICLRIEYDGSAFGGWQKQSSPEIPTVQGSLETAIGKIADSPVKLVCAGRTDAGVHATGQIAHFDCPLDRGERAWTMGANSLLPPTVRVREAIVVSDCFSARFSALSRRYAYVLYDGTIDSALLAGKAVREPGKPDVKAMREGARHLLGELDFSSFRAAGCQSKSPLREVRFLQVYEQRNFLVIDICANAFLQHMVRNIAGALLEVGRGERKPDWICEVLLARDRKVAGVTAPAHGLYLVAVSYPREYGIPSCAVAPPILDGLPDAGQG